MTLTTDIVEKYQELVELQVNEFKDSARHGLIVYRVFYFDEHQPRIFRIDKNGYAYVFERKTIDRRTIEELLRRGLIMKIGNVDGIDIYTTLHADVIFRVLRGRAYQDDLDGRWVGYYDIDVVWEYMPDFNARDIFDLKNVLVKFFTSNNVEYELAVALAIALVRGLEASGFKRIAEWQFKSIERILHDLSGFVKGSASKYYVISAPTAAGKTLVFQVIALAYSLLHKVVAESKDLKSKVSRVLILYPRKSLQKQQLERLLKPVHYVNEELKKTEPLKRLNIEPITVAIDKGVEQERESREIDTGIKCPHAAQHTIKLVLQPSKQEVICTDGSVLDYIVGIVVRGEDRLHIASKKPDILISNPWTLRSRVLSPEYMLSELYVTRGLIILDEAHVYTNVNYVDLVASIRLLYRLRNVKMLPTIVIGSSATIPLDDPRELLSWMLGVGKDLIEPLEYTKLEPQHGRKKRLKIVVTLLPYRLSLETTLQGVIQVILTATSERPLKSLVFVDSISEASTIMSYLETILVKRRAVEICDHLLYTPCRKLKDEDPVANNRASLNVNSSEYDDYSWSHYIYLHGIKYMRDLLNKLSNLINYVGLHHGALGDQERKLVENAFVAGQKKLLISTSTLDLGMDYDDVTFIVQYKTPTSDEAVEQRIGRAGRKDEAARISLAFYIPTITPAFLQRVFSDVKYEKTTVLPDTCTIEQYYLVQALEYELVQRYRDLVLTEQVGNVLKSFRNNVLSYLNIYKINDFKKRWLVNESVCRDFTSTSVYSQTLANALYYAEHNSDKTKDLKRLWHELRFLASRKYARELTQKLTEDVIKKPNFRKLLKELSPTKVENIKKYAENSAYNLAKYVAANMRDAIRVCESVQDIDFDPSLVAQRISRCISDLERVIQETVNDERKLVKDLQGGQGLDSMSTLDYKHVLENVLKVETLRHYRTRIQELVNKLKESVKDQLDSGLLYNIIVSWKYSRKSKKSMCRRCQVSEDKLSRCWYYCLRNVLISTLGNLRIAPLLLREVDTVTLVPIVSHQTSGEVEW